MNDSFSGMGVRAPSLRLLFLYNSHAITASTIIRGTPTPTPTPRPILALSLMPLADAEGEDVDPADVAVELPLVDTEDEPDREVVELPVDDEVVETEFDEVVVLVVEIDVDVGVVELVDSVRVADAGIRSEGRTLK